MTVCILCDLPLHGHDVVPACPLEVSQHVLSKCCLNAIRHQSNRESFCPPNIVLQHQMVFLIIIVAQETLPVLFVEGEVTIVKIEVFSLFLAHFTWEYPFMACA